MYFAFLNRILMISKMRYCHIIFLFLKLYIFYKKAIALDQQLYYSKKLKKGKLPRFLCFLFH